ncbi:MAG: SusC/RagA family TonB-linked outer membrane protein [Williamsia sp.]|nr:SusC/RagA family TonB-linked outer membrane protein [Williamsia sp.]
MRSTAARQRRFGEILYLPKVWRITKITLILVLLVALQTSAKESPLRISMTGNKPSPGTVFKHVHATAAPVFKDITGRVVNENGEPVSGATIAVKETSIRTTTNEAGYFSLKGIDENAVLVITAVNIETYETRVGSRTNMDVAVKTKITAQEDVTVIATTGYQNISRERATGAYDVVGRSVLDKRPVSNLSTALQGLIPGMQAKENADGSFNFLIRGTSTLYADKTPLVVVDGFPVSTSSPNNKNNFYDINPNDVESVTVLKDAAAASIWGSRSANGVIVITTKKSRRKGLNVEANVFSRVSKMIDLDQVLTQASSADQVKYEKLAFTNEWFFNQYAGGFTEITKPLTLAQELLFANKNGKITAAQMNAGLDSLSRISNRDQIRDQLMRRGILTQANINLSGSTEHNRTYASILYENQKEGFQKSGYNRFLFNFNNQYQAGNFLTLSLGANIQYRKQETSGATVDEIQQLSPYETLLNPDGSYSANLNIYNREQLALLPLSKFPYSDWTYNLLREVRGRNFTNEDLSARLQAGINIRILKSLNFDSRVQYERQNNDSATYNSEETFYARNLVNNLVEYDNTTKNVTKVYLPKGGILRSNNTRLESYLVRNQLNFGQNFAGKHNVTAIAGMEVSRYLTTTTAYPYVFGYYPDKLQTTVPQYGYGSSVDIFKDFRGNSGVTVPGSATTFGWTLNKYVSFYSNASYTYDAKYTLSGSIRSDASNYITDDPSLRWSPFWSVGGMWNAKREYFLEHVDLINRLNIRFTYGRNGNQEKSTSTKTLVNTSTTVSSSTGTITATITDNGNPYLRWEKTTTSDLGIDFALFRNKLSGKIDLYDKQGTDITGLRALPAATGTTSQKFNNAKIVNRGIEIQVGTDVKIPGTGITYATSLNYAYNYNNITDLYYPSLYAFDMLGSVTNNVYTSAFVQGRPVGSVYSFTYRGMVNGVPQVSGPKGVLQTFNDAALYNRGLGLQFLNYEGTAVPPHTLGWFSNFSGYGFNLSVLFTGKLGGVYRNPAFNFATTVGSSKTFVDRFVADVFAGDPNIPGFANPKETQTYLWDRYTPYLSGLVESSSYIECKEITLGYNVPAPASRLLKMNNINAFAQLRNPGMVWHANGKGYNPDWLPGQNRPLASYTLGLNFKL